MSQSRPEANDLSAAIGGAAGTAARMALSSEFAAGAIGAAAADIINNLKNGDSAPTPNDSKKPSHSGSPSDTTSPPETPGSKKPDAGGILGELLGQTLPKLNDKGSDKSGLLDQLQNKLKPEMQNMIEKGGVMVDNFYRKITDADRKEAKDTLAKGIDPLIKAEDQQMLKSVQAAIIDGKADDLAKALKPLAGNPENLAKFIKSMNAQLDKGGYNGVELATDSKGNVLVYEKGANTAVSINPATGATELRPIERQPDGSIVLKQGEIINRSVADVMKNVGDEATRSIVNPHRSYKNLEDSIIKPLSERSGGGGGGGGDAGSSPNSLEKLRNQSKPPAPAKPGDGSK